MKEYWSPYTATNQVITVIKVSLTYFTQTFIGQPPDVTPQIEKKHLTCLTVRLSYKNEYSFFTILYVEEIEPLVGVLWVTSNPL